MQWSVPCWCGDSDDVQTRAGSATLAAIHRSLKGHMAMHVVGGDGYTQWSEPLWPMEGRLETEDGSWWDVEKMK